MTLGIRHKTAVALVWVLIILCVAACGVSSQPTSITVRTSTPPPTPNIEATVQARLVEERAVEATVEALIQTAAKAIVEATAQAISTSKTIYEAILEENVLAVRLHLDAGIDPNESFIPPGSPVAGGSALHLAATLGNEEIVQLLLDNGADIDIKAKDDAVFRASGLDQGGTPLQWTAFWGVKDMAEFLVDAGADINAADNGGCTPLCAARAAVPFVDDSDSQVNKDKAVIVEFLKSKGGIRQHIARGRSIEIQASKPVVKTKMSFLDDEGKHRVVRPRASNRQLAMVEITVVNRTSTVMPLLIDEEAAQLGDRRGDRIDALDPFVNSRVVEAADPEEDELAPLLWGEVRLSSNFQVKGWMIFDVPKDLYLGSLFWNEIEEVIADYVDYFERR